MTFDDDLHLLAGAYALDALDADELATYEAHLASCPTCPQEVRELREVAAQLGAAEAVAPSAAFRAAVLDEVGLTSQLPVAQERAAEEALPARAGTAGSPDRAGRESRRAAARAAASTRRWRRLSAGLGLAACLTAVAAIGLGIRGQQLQEERDRAWDKAAEVASVLAAPDIASTTAEAGDGTATVLASAQVGRVLVVARELEVPAEDQTYQLWFIDASGTARSGGTFDPDADGDATVLLQGESQEGDTIGLTVEPEGGSQEPTTTPLFAVPLPA